MLYDHKPHFHADLTKRHTLTKIGDLYLLAIAWIQCRHS